MKILMTLDAVGGVWQHAMDLAIGLRERGVSVVFAGLGPPPDADRLAAARSIGAVEWGDAPLDWLAGSQAELAPVAPWLDRVAAHHAPDVMHLNLPTQAVGLTADLPILTMSHSCLATWFAAVRETDVPADLAWQRHLTAQGLGIADKIVAPSQAHAKALIRQYGRLSNLDVVPNSSRSMPSPGLRHARIVAVGRWWDDGKNGRMLDAAAACSDWPVEMIGPLAGPDGAVLSLDHARQVGPLSHRETLRAIGRAGIFCAPSLYEPFGLAVLEAARAGVPLVLADIPTFRELWSDVAVFFDPDDPAFLADALNEMARDPLRRARLGCWAQDRATRLNPDTQVDAMLDLYCQLARTPVSTITG
ncbi:glycosyltransferase family 4 protein [Paracoccus sp. SM22M-07]|uniref:glycosyltransferase family 4 protein n=1 Tax=Paracoccus sp. SM22M-07 TaxID=1520813 RepID=UPI0009FA495B|nr:glycosyltransferase family 4 protein [Paracoccus sp. SM22M-07]